MTTNFEKYTSVEGLKTVSQLFWHRVQSNADDIAIREKDFGIWNEYSWKDYGETARLAGLGLKALGIERGDVCSIASEINKEWMFADLGIIGIGGVTNGVYPTDAPNQVEYLITDSGTRYYFAEDEEQLDKVLEVRERTPTLEKIIIFDMEGLRNFKDEQCISFDDLLELGRDYLQNNPDCWEAEINAADPEDLMILTYTSGTTGMPKGAMISQRNMMFMITQIGEVLPMKSDDQQLAFLPLAHVAGRVFYVFAPLQSCTTVNIVENLETTVQDQQEVAPTVHFAVPRVWEKQFSTVAMKLKEATALGRYAYEKAIDIGMRAADYRKRGEKLPPLLAIKAAITDFCVLKNVRKMLGIDNARWLSTAAAPIKLDFSSANKAFETLQISHSDCFAPTNVHWFFRLETPLGL